MKIRYRLFLFAILIIGCSPTYYNGKNYIVIKKISYGKLGYKFYTSLDIKLDSLYTNKYFKEGDTIYFNKIKIK